MIRWKCYIVIFGIVIFPELMWLLLKYFMKKLPFLDELSRLFQSSTVSQNFAIWQPLTIKWHFFEYFSNFSRFSLPSTICKLKKYGIYFKSVNYALNTTEKLQINAT